MYQVVEQSENEKMEMYMKFTKEEVCKMLIVANNALSVKSTVKEVIYNWKEDKFKNSNMKTEQELSDQVKEKVKELNQLIKEAESVGMSVELISTKFLANNPTGESFLVEVMKVIKL